MMIVAMTVLKVIGIILCSLLGLVLLLVLLILFLPVKYRGDGHRNEEGMGLQIKLRWLFGLVRVHFAYPKPGNWVVKLLCFTIYKSGGGTSPAEDQTSQNRKQRNYKTAKNTKPAERINHEKHLSRRKSSDKDIDDNLIEYEPLEANTDLDNTAGSYEGNTSDTDVADTNVTDVSNTDGSHKMRETSDDPPTHKKSLWHRFLAFLYKWLAILQQKLSDATYYINLLRAKETVEVYKRTKERLHIVLRSLRPRKLKANIEFGTGAPDTTGMAYGLCSMLYPYFGKYISITPNFEKAIFLGDISMSGWAVGWVIIAGVLRISLDKGIRNFLKKWKREVA
jgi:hypothetical protein